MLAHYTKLDRRLHRCVTNERNIDSERAAQFLESIGSPIRADPTDERGVRTHCRDVCRDICRATHALGFLAHFHHRHRSFRRYAPGRACPVAIEHDISDDEYFSVGKRF